MDWDKLETIAAEFNNALTDLVISGQKIKAVKFIRQATGLNLKESKDIVEGMQEKGFDGIQQMLHDTAHNHKPLIMPWTRNNIRVYLATHGIKES
jgi:ribosomal protein L7/L12